jgi:hypothetical protein
MIQRIGVQTRWSDIVVHNGVLYPKPQNPKTPE